MTIIYLDSVLILYRYKTAILKGLQVRSGP